MKSNICVCFVRSQFKLQTRKHEELAHIKIFLRQIGILYSKTTLYLPQKLHTTDWKWMTIMQFRNSEFLRKWAQSCRREHSNIAVEGTGPEVDWSDSKWSRKADFFDDGDEYVGPVTTWKWGVSKEMCCSIYILYGGANISLVLCCQYFGIFFGFELS